MDETIRFYDDVLGFECVNPIEGWAVLKKDTVEIMISLPNSYEPFEKPTFTGSLYFSSDDVDAPWNQIKGKTAVVYPIENFYYGMREFAIRDNNGHILQSHPSVWSGNHRTFAYSGLRRKARESKIQRS
jgi:uncharacterized glyoxalase superfamily protein PhnB